MKNRQKCNLVTEEPQKVDIQIHSDFYHIQSHILEMDIFQKCVERVPIQLAATPFKSFL